jgi:hypothetical protein
MTSPEALPLLDRPCTQYGFYLPMAARRRIADQLPHDPTFAEAVFVAEGLDAFRASLIALERD